MNTIPMRNLRVLGAGLAVLVLLAFLLDATSRPHLAPADAGLPTTADAVSLGLLDQQVVDEIRAGGSDAFVSLNVEPLIAEVYRRFPDLASRAELIAELDRQVAALKDQLASTPVGSQVVDRLDGLSSIRVHLATEADALAVARLPFVTAVRANRTLELFLKESTVLVHEPEVKAEGYDGNGTYVAVLDTHNRWAEFPDFYAEGSVASNYEAKGATVGSGKELHGTHVASTVLAMAPAAKIIAVNVFDWPEGRARPGASSISINDGMQHVLDLKRAWIQDHTQCCNVVAVNLSLGTTSFRYIPCTDDYSFDIAYAYGIVPVVAAGNDAHPADDDLFADPNAYLYGIGDPGCGRHALSVGSSTDGAFAATDHCRSSDAVDLVSNFSQTSTSLGLLAPGQCITAAGGEMNGTSQATPHVAGGVAVLASAKRDATPAEIWSALVSSGPTISDNRFDPPVVKHRLDLEAAVKALLGGGAASPGPAVPAPPLGSKDGLELGQTALDLADPLSGGERGALGTIRLRNTGASTATYRLAASSAGSSRASNAPASWFEFSPETVTLAPGETGTVRASVTIPLGADPGTYVALLLPRNTDPAHDTAVPGLRTTFTVAGGTTFRGIVALGARAAASPWTWVVSVVLLLGFARVVRRRRA